jgi:hypothetical protein
MLLFLSVTATVGLRNQCQGRCSARTPAANPSQGPRKAGSSLIFSLEFDWNTASLMSVMLQPGYDWQVFRDELATLERAAVDEPL